MIRNCKPRVIVAHSGRYDVTVVFVSSYATRVFCPAVA
jgi:hypothetical protein